MYMDSIKVYHAVVVCAITGRGLGVPLHSLKYTSFVECCHLCDLARWGLQTQLVRLDSCCLSLLSFCAFGFLQAKSFYTQQHDSKASGDRSAYLFLVLELAILR